MSTLSLQTVLQILKEDNLLKEYLVAGKWNFDPQLAPTLNFTQITYNSKKVQQDSLFFCKGLNFKAEYLYQALAQGATCYIGENIYEEANGIGIIVTDIQKAMAKIARVFFGYPDKTLTTIALTGTKGKTSTLYFILNVLREAFPGKVAMTSTEQTFLDGQTFQRSVNSTPEALDLFAMMAQARDHGMNYFIMEVSSQAYKVNRVYGLTFDYGIFLNISPDHISPIEHPTFDDYFYCKRQLLKNSRHLILNHDADYFDLLYQTAQLYTTDVSVYGSQGFAEDLTFTPHVLAKDLKITTAEEKFAKSAGDYTISLPGNFNLNNATAAITVASLLNLPQATIAKGLAETVVPGRMMQYTTPTGGVVIVDYAHNYTSVEQVVKYVQQVYPERKIGLVVGANGIKAFSRRKDFGRIITNYMDYAYLTADNPNTADPMEIIQEIKSYVTKELPIVENPQRKEIIYQAVTETDDQRVLIIAGKGTEDTQKTRRGVEPYDGDGPIVEQAITLMKARDLHE